MTRMQTTSNDQDHNGRIEPPPPPTRFSIYENDAYVQDRYYLKSRISIGRSPKADLVLNHQSIEDIHALVYFEGGKAYLTNKFPENGLRLNGRSVALESIHHEDVIDIGPFLLKFKFIEKEKNGIQEKEDSYRICLVNQYKSAGGIQKAAERLAGILRIDTDKILPLVKKSHCVIKKRLAIMEAARWQNALHKAGVICEIQLESGISLTDVFPGRKHSDTKTGKTNSARVKVKETWRSVADIADTDAGPSTGKIEQRNTLNTISEKKGSHDRNDPKVTTSSRDIPGSRLQDDLKQWHQSENSQSTAVVKEMRVRKAPQTSSVKKKQNDAQAAFEEKRTSDHLASPSGEKDTSVTIDNLRRASWVMVPAEINEADTQEPLSDEEIVKVILEPFAESELHQAARENVFQMRKKPVRPHWPEGFLEEDEPDEDEDIWEAPFSLAEELKPLPSTGAVDDPAIIRLQVIKTIGERIWETAHLDKGGKYHIIDETGTFCLVHFRSVEPTVYIRSPFEGVVKDQNNDVVDTIDRYKCEAYCFNRKGLVYGVPVPDKGAVVVDLSGSQYTISKTCLPLSPVAEAGRHFRFQDWRHWVISAGIHLVLILCLCMYTYLQPTGPEKLEPRFATVDPDMIKRLELAKPRLPVKREPPPKVAPQRPVDDVAPRIAQKPPEKEHSPALKAPKKRETSSKVAKTTTSSRHPDAGGGYGEGNIKNRNINQAGILNALSTVSADASSGAIAAVTNLDAAPLSGTAEKQFTVGGLKGALGNKKISVATGEIIQTKGAEQVLRSAGTRGKRNEVAALERGTTGKKQVQATVSAKMNQTVRIEGGMSREMVKQVIDQHLEEITHCYEMALLSNPSISGRIVFEWKILMNGHVGQIGIVASNVNSHEIHDCIKAAIKTWQFPEPVGAEVIVSYPFVFDLVAF